MGKLDQLKKMQNKQQTSAMDLLQGESAENIFDEDQKEERKEPVEETKESVKKKDKPQTIKTEKKEDKFTKEPKIVQPVKNKKHSVVIPDSQYKTGTIRVPEELYGRIEKLIKDISSLTYTHFANQSIINCLNCDFKLIMHYNEQKVVIKAKNEGFNLFASTMQKTTYKVIPFNLPTEKYEEVIKLVSENETIGSMNDFFVNCLYTQLEQCEVK